MEKLYDQDSHLRFFTAKVLSCEEAGSLHAIILNRTAFYPEGGGQPADTGMLGGLRVTDVQERQGTIFHLVGGPLEPGSDVDGAIDWDLRFSRMQQHSGEHIVSGLVGRMFGFDNVGFHLGSDVVTVDFNGVLSDTDLERIEHLANAAVYENLEVEAFTPAPQDLSGLSYRSKIALDGNVRIVRIPGYDACACCGMHVARTGEIGLIKLLSGRRHKGGTRLEMLCGYRALQDFAARHRDMSELSVLLSARLPDVPAAVKRLMTENDSLKKELAAMREKRLSDMVSETCTLWLAKEKSASGWVISKDGLEPSELRRFTLLLTERISIADSDEGAISESEKRPDERIGNELRRRPDWLIALSANAGGGCYYVAARTSVRKPVLPPTKPAVAESAIDLRQLAKVLNSACKGRGGGTPELVQGSLEADRMQAENVLHSFL